MGSRPLVMYVAAGAGLGHLVRGLAMCTALEKKGMNTRILTHSPHAEKLSRLIKVSVDFIPSDQWVNTAAAFALNKKPDLLVLDTFPWGLRGEWAGIYERELSVVFVARRLKIESYLDAANISWDRRSPLLRRVIVSEPLDDEYLWLLSEAAGEIHKLPGRIRFYSDREFTPVPPDLYRMLSEEQVWLVVHSGPREEVDRLVHLARLGIEKQGRGKVAVVSPHPLVPMCDPASDIKNLLRETSIDQISSNPPLLKRGMLMDATCPVARPVMSTGYPPCSFPSGKGGESSKPSPLVGEGRVRGCSDHKSQSYRDACTRGVLAEIAPGALIDTPYPVFDYFPASCLFSSAFRVVTGAGYNTVAEMSLMPEKWIPVAFERRYDDQAERLSGPEGGLSDGSAEAARIIEEWL